jgi:hypothetical protein
MSTEENDAMEHLFSCGTLQPEAVQIETLGRRLSGQDPAPPRTRLRNLWR